MSVSCLSTNIFNTVSSKLEFVNKNEVPNPPDMLSKNQNKVLEHQERLRNFIEEYTREILTRKDFRLLNNVFNPTTITEKELNNMEVVGDGFEHIDILHNRDEFNDSNSLFNDNSQLIEEVKTSGSLKKSKTTVPYTQEVNNQKLFET